MDRKELIKEAEGRGRGHISMRIADPSDSLSASRASGGECIIQE